MKILTIAVLLTLAPGLALAMGCDRGKKDVQAMTCAAGSTYDADAKACLPISS